MMTTQQIINYPTVYKELSMLAFKRFLAYLRRLRRLQIKLIKHGKIRVFTKGFYSKFNQVATYSKDSDTYKNFWDSAFKQDPETKGFYMYI